MIPADIKVLVGVTEGFTSSLNLQFSNGLRLSTANMLFLSKPEKDKIRDQFTEVCRSLHVAPEEIAKIKL